MKKLFFTLAFVSLSALSFSQTYVSGYYKADGTYVKGHVRSNRNATNHDNYSTRSNINPYTGTIGSRAKDYSVDAYNYGSGATIYTGSQGGQYYINSNNNKTYVPKRTTNNSYSPQNFYYSAPTKKTTTKSYYGW